VFEQLDLNGDGELDYIELMGVLAAYQSAHTPAVPASSPRSAGAALHFCTSVAPPNSGPPMYRALAGAQAAPSRAGFTLDARRRFSFKRRQGCISLSCAEVAADSKGFREPGKVTRSYSLTAPNMPTLVGLDLYVTYEQLPRALGFGPILPFASSSKCKRHD
jgi:hypothetical protein